MVAFARKTYIKEHRENKRKWKTTKLKIGVAFCSCMLISVNAFASEYEAGLSIAAGQSNTKAYLLEMKKNYKAFVKRGEFSIKPTLGLSGIAIDANHGNTVYGATLAGGLSFEKSSHYLNLSFGPTYISDKHIGKRDMGSHFHFATNISLGTRFGHQKRHNIACFIRHYSHAGINGSQNPGYNIYGVSYKYSF